MYVWVIVRQSSDILGGDRVYMYAQKWIDSWETNDINSHRLLNVAETGDTILSSNSIKVIV